MTSCTDRIVLSGGFYLPIGENLKIRSSTLNNGDNIFHAMSTYTHSFYEVLIFVMYSIVIS